VGGLLPVLAAATALGLVVGFSFTGGLSGDSHSEASPAANSAGQSVGDKATGQPVSFDITLGDMFIKPKSIEVPAGSPVTVKVTNTATQQHTLALEGRDTPLIDPGKTVTIEWGTFSKSEQAWCTVPGHKDAGMLMDIKVTGAADPAPGDSSDARSDSSSDSSSSNATIDASEKPGDDWKPFDPTVKPADGATTHDVTFNVQEKEMEVAPGVKQIRWTYNGTAPGPILRGHVGDVFNVKLVNGGTMAHSIDFHASKVSPSVQMRQLKPGESLVYQFKAKFSGIFTYHCGADPMIYHMGNGMFGAVIIDPPSLGKVDKEIVLVQSELYLGPQGKTGDLKHMLSGQDDAVVFNGYFNQYAYAPVKVDPGQRVRVWLVDAGPNENIAFHVVGTIFDTVWKEGHYTLKPDNAEHGGSQTLDLQPTQGGFVEFTLDDAGTYPFITHKMMNMSRGGLGLFQVGDAGGES
jgi:Putative multicopper oxidases